ncbi:unnamed protein product [Rhizoctonia solani]|uniref:Uncharacterized protein n=1 Tax=Rhizoctonia solani TaxID=456999 RepID=A0A8H3DV97_9AGAM|nr:unnamed protein product [Rhizoctonia solani]
MSLSPGTTNNQHPQPRVVSVPTYPRDSKYYYSDGSGQFLVDGVLFKVGHGEPWCNLLTFLSWTSPNPTYVVVWIYKVQFTLVFGPRPASPTNQTGGHGPMYIEDILSMLSNSSDYSIEIHGVTAAQFRDYLLILLGRPYDDQYINLITAYLEPTKHTKHLCVRYLDIATLARRFGMVKLEYWAIGALHAIFTRSAETLAAIALEEWDSGTVLRLRALTRNTKVDLSALAMIQHIISLGSSDETIRRTLGDRINDLPCVGLYHNLKTSDADPVLFGCAFLNVLSLGHGSPVWARCLTRDDRALLYAAQAQLVDTPRALELDLPVGWSSELGLATACDICKKKYVAGWNQCFGQSYNALGSGLPLKDVSLLARLPIHRHTLWGLTKPGAGLASLLSGTCENKPPCSVALLDSVDTHIRQVFTKASAKYKKIAEEL